MTRNDFEKKSWIPISRKLPPDDREYYLAWNPQLKRGFVELGFVLHEHAKKLLEIGNNVEVLWEKFAPDRIFSHWRPIGGPR